MPRRRETAAESAATTAVPLVRQPHGGALLAGGRPGNAGGGQPKAAVRVWCRSQLLDLEVQAVIARIVRNPEAPNYASTLRLLFAYGLGPPVQQLELTGLAAIAARIEQLPDAEIERLLTASDAELDRVLLEGD